jgi:hypothetical protein
MKSKTKPVAAKKGRRSSNAPVSPLSPMPAGDTGGPGLRRPPSAAEVGLNGDTGRDPIRIETVDGFKIAVCSAGYGSNATATFMRLHIQPLASEIEMGRAIWARTEARGKHPQPELLKGEAFPLIERFCTHEDIKKHISDSRQRTALAAAGEIMQQLFPKYTTDSIARRGRASKEGRSKN